MGAWLSLEVRDLEILRALLRVRYLTMRQLGGAFFSCPRIARRRIHRLSEHDLIRPHTKGLPLALGYKAWRLTPRGLDEVAHAFPDEVVPDGFMDRVTTGGLQNVLHREAIADLYLSLVVPSRTNLSERDLAAHRRWAAEMRRRAASIQWQPDGDVVISLDSIGDRIRIVPDAVVRSAKFRRRVFVELDRSTKDRKRIRENLVRYGRVLPRYDLEGDTPAVLYVVRSQARKENLDKVARSIFLNPPPGFLVLQVEEAVEWLREEVLGLGPEPPRQTPEERLRFVAKDVYRWVAALEGVLRANGMRDALDRDQPGFLKDGVDRLLALRAALADGEGERR